MRRKPIYGVMAEFETSEALLEATKATCSAGYKRFDAFSPMPIEGLAEACGRHKIAIAPLTLAGGILGGLGAFALEYWINVINYPLNIGGRPYNSWPSFIPVTFELAILGAALTCVISLLALNGLPSPYHPLFNEPRFALASRNRFFLCIEARDSKFDLAGTRQFLEGFAPQGVYDVET